MFIAYLLTATSLVVAKPLTAVRNPPTAGRSCGAFKSDADIKLAEEHFRANFVPPRERFSNASIAATAASTIQVYFHVISADATPAGGNIDDSQITNQLAVLNQAYTPAGLSFVLAGTDRTVNPTWFTGAGSGTPAQTEMKTALRQGDGSTLNVYTVDFSSGPTAGELGYATFPSDLPTDAIDDGVVIQFTSLPGGAATGYNLGQTLTHETGHWVGLYHTFQGGCDASDGGDLVDDTPAEAVSSADCLAPRDTCPGGGTDPINNYMDYSPDSCMNQFTPGQVARLQDQIRTYREIGV